MLRLSTMCLYYQLEDDEGPYAPDADAPPNFATYSFGLLFVIIIAYLCNRAYETILYFALP